MPIKTSQNLTPRQLQAADLLARGVSITDTANQIGIRRETEMPVSQSATDLTPLQAQAAELLAAGRTVTQAAQEIGKARETVSRWQSIPAFQQVLRSSLAQRQDTVRAQLGRLIPVALAALEEDLRDASNRMLRQRAALAILDRAGMGPKLEAKIEVRPVAAKVDLSMLTPAENLEMAKLLRRVLGKPEPWE